MTDKKLTVREQAALTAAEIRRRGWVKGCMADLGVDDFDKSARPKPGALANCKVCLVGGAAAALEGNPRRGDEWWQLLVHPELLEEVADRVAPEWREHSPSPITYVTSWNDRQESADVVLALLDDIANTPVEVAA